jgi:hypothetical protein
MVDKFLLRGHIYGQEIEQKVIGDIFHGGEKNER